MGGRLGKPGRGVGLVAAALALGVMLAPAALAMSRPPREEPWLHPKLWPKAQSPDVLTERASERAIRKLMAGLTVEEKVAQTIQADIGSFSPDDFAHYPLGGILAGGSSAPADNARATPTDWADLTRRYRGAARRYWGTRAAILPLFGVDAVHGHQKVIGATLFPHNIGLGAAHDPALVARVGAATAEEVAATGIDWTFAPTLAVPRDERWGRTFEGYAEDPDVVAAYAGQMILGLQGPLSGDAPMAPGHIVATPKHFLGDGATARGQDQGDAKISEREMTLIHAPGYAAAIDAGALSIMVSFSSWNGVKMIANKPLLTDILKGRMGFDGFVIGDWNAQGQVPGCTNESCPAALNAGLDMFMAPDSWRDLFTNTVAQVKAGIIPMARLDDAVRRILRAKMKAGLFAAEDHPVAGRLALIGAAEHRALAREAVRKSLVLLKNDGVLPLRANAHVLVTGEGADRIGKQCGGWSLTWQGHDTRNADFPGAQSIFAGLKEALGASGGKAVLSPSGRFKRRPDAAIVVFGEDPYAEFDGDRPTLHYKPERDPDLKIMRALKARGIPVVAVLLSGRPLWVNPAVNTADAFVAAFLPGTEGGGVADLLIGDVAGHARNDFTGRLSFSWPARPDRDARALPLFKPGYGLSYANPGVVAQLSEDPGDLALASNDVLFTQGNTEARLRLMLRDHGGEREVAEGGAQSPREILTLLPPSSDAPGQARSLRWNGTGLGTLSFEGSTRSLAQRMTHRALSIRMRIDEAPTKTVELGMACDENCIGTMDVTRDLARMTVGRWETLKIRLDCVAQAGADMTRIAEPLLVKTEGRLSISVADVRLEKSDERTICPAISNDLD